MVKEMSTFLVVLEPGRGRDEGVARNVRYRFDDVVHRWLVPHALKRFYFDRWGVIRSRIGHCPLLRMICGPVPPDCTLVCSNGDRFDYRRHNWRVKVCERGGRASHAPKIVGGT